MKRQTIKEATRYKVEWCCDIPIHPDGVESPVVIALLDAMHNAQAMYLKYVSGPRYRGTGEMFAEVTDIGTLRITMRWAGTKNHGHMLGRRDPAFHAKGEVPKPMLIGTVEPWLPAKEAVAKAMKETPEAFVPPIPASEPEPDPVATEAVHAALVSQAAGEAGLEMSPPEVVWPKTVKGLRRLARVMEVDVSDIKGEGSKKRIIARLEVAGGRQSETPAPEAP